MLDEEEEEEEDDDDDEAEEEDGVDLELETQRQTKGDVALPGNTSAPVRGMNRDRIDHNNNDRFFLIANLSIIIEASSPEISSIIYFVR